MLTCAYPQATEFAYSHTPMGLQSSTMRSGGKSSSLSPRAKIKREGRGNEREIRSSARVRVRVRACVCLCMCVRSGTGTWEVQKRLGRSWRWMKCFARSSTLCGSFASISHQPQQAQYNKNCCQRSRDGSSHHFAVQTSSHDVRFAEGGVRNKCVPLSTRTLLLRYQASQSTAPER